MPAPAQPVAFITRQSPGVIDTIVVDAIKREVHPLTNTITDHPVEEGSPISDHSRQEANKLTLDCFVSNTPLSLEQRQRIETALGPYGFATPSADDAASVTGKPQASITYADLVFTQLAQLHEKPRLITVQTSLRTYVDMAIESSTFTRESKTANGLEFTVTFKRVKIVKNKLTRIVVAKDKRAQPKKKGGAAIPAEVDKEPASLANQGAQLGADKLKGRGGVLGAIGDFFSKAVAGPGQ